MIFINTNSYTQKDLYSRIKIYINGNYPRAAILESAEYDLVGYNGENERIVIAPDGRFVKILISQNLGAHISEDNSTIFTIQDQSDVRACMSGIDVIMRMKFILQQPVASTPAATKENITETDSTYNTSKESSNAGPVKRTINLFFKDRFPYS